MDLLSEAYDKIGQNEARYPPGSPGAYRLAHARQRRAARALALCGEAGELAVELRPLLGEGGGQPVKISSRPVLSTP